MAHIRYYFEWSALAIEAIGIIVILVAVVLSLITLVSTGGAKSDNHSKYMAVRQKLGRGIILGLEFLVAADIIHTVAVELTLKTVTALGLIVLIRTFLSFTLEAELEGHWPWQKHKKNDNANKDDPERTAPHQ
ncbi:MAG TPA: DUF1622 domain-containing protein [Marinagarivorans sp.]